MADIFGISVSALQALQNAINVTSNNVANASTPGYDKETVDLTEAVPQSNGKFQSGAGVLVSGISRAYSQAAAAQLNDSQSQLGQLTALQGYSTQIDNLFGTTAGGLSTALQSYYGAWSDVANDPTSTASRQALLGQAQSVASSFQNTSAQLNALNTDVNNRLSEDVQQINSTTAAIASLNQQIVVGTAQGGNQPPNELLDQRDQLLSSLSKLVAVTTTTNTDGSINVAVGNGQPLVTDNLTTQLKTVPNPFNAAQYEIATSTSSNIISGSITSGDLGGLLAARAQVIDPALNQLGQLATAVGQSANSQQAAGVDLNGSIGAAIFSIGAPVASASSANTDSVSASVSIASGGLGVLSPDSYVFSFQGGTPLLTDTATGATSRPTLTGSNTYSAAGFTVTLSGSPASSDQFLIQPTAGAAASIKVALSDPTKLAAAAAIKASAAVSNSGAAAISPGTVLDASNTALLTPVTIQFSSPTSYSINGGAPQTYSSGGNIDFNGWEVQISGTPAANDSFTVGPNTGGSGDNRNALASANQQTSGVLNNGQTSITAGVSALITGLGSQAQQINTAQTAQASVNSAAANQVSSASGVNLDEEAASLLQWQQAYQASAQALAIGKSLFTTLLDSVNGTYS